MTTWLLTRQISFRSIWYTLGLEALVVPSMGAGWPIPRLTFKRVKHMCLQWLITLFSADILCRQNNMDYCMSELLKYNTQGLRHAMLYYDIMCQYLVHMMSWFENNPYLELPTSLTHIAKAIGLFHIHGHKDKCFVQYAPTFIPGAGIVDGEIIETLWEPLNPIVPSARKASPEHRREIMDDHMNYSNWKKLIRISNLSILWLNLCHRLIPDLSGSSAGEIPCRSQRASEGWGCIAIYWIDISAEPSKRVEDSWRRCTSKPRSGC